MALVKFAEWLPDLPVFDSPGSDNITNVLPKTAGSYGPAPSLVTTTPALGARCQGAIFSRDNAANIYGFAGDATKLYQYSAGSTSWVDVSGGPYNTSNEGGWAFAVYGEQIIATNFNDPIQTITMGSTPFADLSANAPKARYIAIVKDFVMVANTDDGVDGPVPQRVWWSAIDDPTTWPTPGSVTAAQLLSDYQILAGDGGWNQGIVGGLSGADVIVLQEKRVFRGMFIGPPVIFSFDVIEGARGTPAPGSIVSVGALCFYLGDNGYYACDGISSQAIGQGKVDNTFWADVDQQYLYRITATADPFNKIVYWAYPGPQNQSGRPNRILAYNYEIGRWSLLKVQTEVLLRSYSVGYTMDQLDVFGDMESMPQISLDSRYWVGGLLSLSAFTGSHRLATFSGPNLAASLDTGETQLNEKGRAYVSRVYPVVDTAVAQMQVGVRNNLYTEPVFSAPVTLNSTTASCPVRANGFYHRVRMDIPAGAEWQHAQGIQFDFVPAGRR